MMTSVFNGTVRDLFEVYPGSGSTLKNADVESNQVCVVGEKHVNHTVDSILERGRKMVHPELMGARQPQVCY